MSRIYVKSLGPDNWQQYLAKPELHWVTGFSAKTLAHSWEDTEDLPREVGAILSSLGPVELLLAIPEHKVPLPGGNTDSQSDVFALARTERGLLTCAIEGKVDETFGPTLGEWLVEASPGKITRLEFLTATLCLPEPPQGSVRYQLLHRTASALIEAKRFAARDAAMIVQSFSPTRMWFEDFQAFCQMIGAGSPQPDKLATLELPTGIRLHLGWATGDPRYRSL